MKKFLYFVLAASAGLLLASCKEKTSPEEAVYTVVEATYTDLVKGTVQEGDVVTVPVSATSGDGSLALNFFTEIPFLSPGSYTIGQGVGNYNGHFKNASVDADIDTGLISVTLDGVDKFTISGTVRLKDAVGTIVKIRANGVIEYDIPTNFYYTEEDGKTAGIDAHIYKIYNKATSVQVAQLAVASSAEGSYAISPEAGDGKAVYGSANDGCWFFDASYGTYVMLHGGVTVGSTFPGRKDFYFTDKFSFTDKENVEFIYCEKKEDIVPALPVSSGDVSFMMGKFYSIESPVIPGKYELTIKINYTAGDEFLAFTGITDTPNPLLEVLKNDGDGTGGVAFMPVSYLDYLKKDAGNKSAIAPACFYVWDGKKYAIPFEEGFAMVANLQKARGIVAGLFAPTNMSYALPEPLQSGLAAKGMSIWNLMFYYF